MAGPLPQGLDSSGFVPESKRVMPAEDATGVGFRGRYVKPPRGSRQSWVEVSDLEQLEALRKESKAAERLGIEYAPGFDHNSSTVLEDGFKTITHSHGHGIISDDHSHGTHHNDTKHGTHHNDANAAFGLARSEEESSRRLMAL